MAGSITDVPGILAGHAHDLEAATGVTVVLALAGAVGGVDVRGSAPATRETDLLEPGNLVQSVQAVALCGGSAMGLDAVGGVVQWLREQGLGFPAGPFRVPIVPAAAIFDLGIGRGDRFPDAAMGYAACAAAGPTMPEGCVGAGAGASVGKLLGLSGAMKGGLGTWSETLHDGTTVGALVVVNAFGDVWREGGAILAGVRDPASGRLLDTMALLRDPRLRPDFARPDGPTQSNTTIAVVATDAQLDKAEARKLAQMAQDGLARTIRPVHTPFDGDAVFAMATGRRPALPMITLGSVAADVLARAVERAVLTATALGGLPAAQA